MLTDHSHILLSFLYPVKGSYGVSHIYMRKLIFIFNEENLPFPGVKGIKFPHWGSSGLEDGLINLVWETGSYELWPLGGHTHSFHNSGQGFTRVPPACERRSLLDGNLPRRVVEERNQVREQYSQNSATRSRLTSSRHTLARTPGSRAIGGKVYRRSLGHFCTIASNPSGAGWIREYQRGDIALSPEQRSGTPKPGQTLQIYFTTSGWSIHSPGLGPCLDRTSAPINKNQGFLHMSKAHRHRRVTLIMRSEFPLGENLVLCQH